VRNLNLLAVGLVGLLTWAGPARAEGNLAANGTDLTLSIDTENLSFSQDEWDLETGKYYRLEITSDGAEEISVVAPELWRNVWINDISGDDFAVETQAPSSLDFEEEGSVTVSFVPIRPGVYDIYVPGYENRGLKGRVVVK
jgi:hypothetical protein